MKTIEDIYAGIFEEHEAIQAARGCNQYKHVPGCDKADGDGRVNKHKEAMAKKEGEKEASELKKKFEAADQKVRNAISRIYDLQQEKEKSPNKTFSLTVDKANEVRKKQIDIDIRSLEKELNAALAERDKLSEALRSIFH